MCVRIMIIENFNIIVKGNKRDKFPAINRIRRVELNNYGRI